jgi:ABC-2 type transport system ATP-binding protein
MILNVVNKTSGNFEWFGGSLTTSDALKNIGAIIEHPNFYPYMSARQNLELVCKIKEISYDNIQEKLNIVGLADRQDDKFKTYSLGMKQRLAIASALLNNPKMLILDEPTNGLDPKGIHEIRAIIKQIAEAGTTIILASHLLDEVEKVCDYVVILQEGNKIYEGNVKEITAKQNWFEIESDDLSHVKYLLDELVIIDRVEVIDNILIAYLLEDTKGSVINKYLSENGIFINSIVKKQPTLEENFLQITQ